MIHLYQPSDTAELLVLKALFERDKIPYFVQNELGAYAITVGSERMSIMVAETHAERARALV